MLYSPEKSLSGAIDCFLFVLRYFVFDRFLEQASPEIQMYRWSDSDARTIEIIYAYSEEPINKLPVIAVAPVRLGWGRLGVNEVSAVQAPSNAQPDLITTHIVMGPVVRVAGVVMTLRTLKQVEMMNLADYIAVALKIADYSASQITEEALAKAVKINPALQEKVQVYPKLIGMQVGDISLATQPNAQGEWVAQIGVNLTWKDTYSWEIRPTQRMHAKLIKTE